MGKEGSKAKLLKISRKADRDAPCDQARMLDSVRTEVLHDAKPTNERKLALGLRLSKDALVVRQEFCKDATPTKQTTPNSPFYLYKEVYRQSKGSAKTEPLFFMFNFP